MFHQSKIKILIIFFCEIIKYSHLQKIQKLDLNNELCQCELSNSFVEEALKNEATNDDKLNQRDLKSRIWLVDFFLLFLF